LDERIVQQRSQVLRGFEIWVSVGFCTETTDSDEEGISFVTGGLELALGLDVVGQRGRPIPKPRQSLRRLQRGRTTSRLAAGRAAPNVQDNHQKT
jgi:hypothetical protein